MVVGCQVDISDPSPHSDRSVNPSARVEFRRLGCKSELSSELTVLIFQEYNVLHCWLPSLTSLDSEAQGLLMKLIGM